MKRLLALALACVPTLLFGSQPSQSPQPPQPPRPTFRTGADFIRVDVFATKDDTPIHDLRLEDFEVLEDGKPQKIETFEHVLIRAGGPQATRIEPNTVRESRAMAEDPRTRVFALFLDTPHVTIMGSHNIRRPIVNMVDRVMGESDLLGVMTPYDSARDLTLARKTTVLEGFLTRNWDWGERDRLTSPDPKDDKYYWSCYGDEPSNYGTVALELAARRREKRTLDALKDLVVHLDGIREERKAVLVVTDGWLLFKPDRSLSRVGADGVIPGKPPIFVGPGGKIGIGNDPRNNVGGVSEECARDRFMLSLVDNEQDFRYLLETANRANVSFYPIDPRGLAVFDVDIGSPLAQQGIIADDNRRRGREESIRTMAVATDGHAVVGSNDIDRGLRRLSDDLSSYYLLGYYSPAGTDGRYHAIDVRVKRPGVSVRSRRGYRAVSAEEVAASVAVAEAATPNPVTAVLATLASVRPGVRLHLRAAPGAGGDHAIAVIGEIDASVRSEWSLGGTALVEVLPKEGGQRVAAQETTFPAGKSAFMTKVALPVGTNTSVFTIRVRVRPLETGGMPLQDALDVSIARGGDGSVLSQPILYRRGLATGVEYVPAADPRFRRSDRIRVEVFLPLGAGAIQARLLDRNGNALPVPITIGPGKPGGAGGEGPAPLIGELALAPLAMGDYIIELSYQVGGAVQRSLTPFRIVL